jgi:uncharacterized protein
VGSALRRVGQWPATVITTILLALIAAYQRVVSPMLGPRCRFSPSCSHYAAESLRKYGVIVGVGRAVWRVLRCQPLCRGGYDPP